MNCKIEKLVERDCTIVGKKIKNSHTDQPIEQTL